ncbi:MAG: hypothetical protein D6698_15025 [Gammaproteobacteria bacterium]|nr:MAG: hypothetical protein D6698_15025 [Gammaproteobacteria bacterium]
MKLTFILPNGKEMEFPANALPEKIKEQAMLHGLAQKLGDKLNKTTSVGEMEALLTELWEQLISGQWNASRGPSGGLLAKAIARIKGIELADAAKVLSEMDDETKKALRKHPAIEKAILEIKMEELEGEDSDLPI